MPFAKAPPKTAFDGLEDWLRERFFRHDGNADVIRQELASEHGIVIGLRSVELRVQPWRRELRARRQATMRFETRPGHQLQIDFGDTKVWTGEERIKIHLFVATLGYSRRYERGSILITSNPFGGRVGRRVRRPGGGHRDPGQVAAPLHRDHHSGGQLPTSRKA